MADPFRRGSVRRAMWEVKNMGVGKDVKVYPREVMQKAIDATKDDYRINPPASIFVPSKRLLRRMIRALAEFGGKEDDSKFLLRFGLIDNTRGLLQEKKNKL